MKDQFNGSLTSNYDTDIPDQSATVEREMRVSLAFIIWDADAIEETSSLEVVPIGGREFLS